MSFFAKVEPVHLTISIEKEKMNRQFQRASLDNWGRFSDSEMQQKFEFYCLEQRSLWSVLIVIVMVTVWVVLETVASLQLENDKSFTVPLSVTSFCLVAISWLLSVAMVYCRRSHTSYSFQSSLQVILIAVINILMMLKLIKYIVYGSYVCVPYFMEEATKQQTLAFLPYLPYLNGTMLNLPSNDIPSCPSSDSYLSMVSINVLIVMSVCPLLLSAIIYEPRLYYVFSLAIIMGFLMIYAVYDTFFTIFPLLIALMIIAILLLNLHLQRIKSFLNNYRLQQVLEETEKNADKLHAMEMRSMIGNVAHDLKTPLASFATGMDLIQDILSSTKQMVTINGLSFHTFEEVTTSIQNCVNNIRNTNAFMLMTINRCIDYTKTSKGMKLFPKNETIDLQEVIDFPMTCMKNIQDRITIHLEPFHSDICNYIITDKQWLQENLLCLLSNAVKYSSQGEVIIRTTLLKEKPEITSEICFHSLVHFNSEADLSQHSYDFSGASMPYPSIEMTSTASLTEYLLFEVEDTGIGISETAMKGLFAPFKQAQRLAGGTGLGLYSLARRLEALKGFYGVKNRSDGKQGTLFWFAIPYRPDKEFMKSIREKADHLTDLTAVTLTTGSPTTAMNHPTESSLEVLVVDDSPSIVKISSMMLHRQGHVTSTAQNGEEAIKTIQEKWKVSQKGFDFVLMDLQMPVMDGLEATHRLRALEAQEAASSGIVRHQLIIGVSANSDHETMTKAFDAGVDDFLGKPFSMDTLAMTLQKHMIKQT